MDERWRDLVAEAREVHGVPTASAKKVKVSSTTTPLSPLVVDSSASNGASSVLKKDQLRKLEGAVAHKLDTTEFGEVYRWVREQQPLFVYSYQANEELRADGSSQATEWDNQSTGTHIQTIARSIDDAVAMNDDLPSIDGPLFRVDFKLSERNFEETLPESSNKYPESSLAVNAVYSAVLSQDRYLDSGFDPQFTRNLMLFR